MRLQLIRPSRRFCALFFIVLGFVSTSRAQEPPASDPEPAPAPLAAPETPRESPIHGSVDARTGVYYDSDHTTISTTTVAGRALIKERVALEARYLVDVVSSASVDVVTAATGAFRDTRHEVSAGGGYRDGTNTINAGYIYSRENDWTSHTVTLGGSRDLLQHNLTLGIGASFGLNDIYRSGDQNFYRSLTTGGGTVSMSYTLSPRDLLSLNYTFAYLSGYQASPYRYVVYYDQGIRASQPESTPDTRARHALTARYHHHLFKNSALQLSLRGYYDDWQIFSGTVGADYLIGIRDFVIAPHVRFYAQRHAGFYEPVYMERRVIMTADREMSTFVDLFGGLRAWYVKRRLGPIEELRAEIKVDGFYFYFFDFVRLISRYGLVADLAIGISL